MKAGIHPDYEKALITCACGRVTETRSTVGELHVEICSHCHPFFTGRQKLVDTAGRVERFMAKYGMEEGEEKAEPQTGVSAAPVHEPAEEASETAPEPQSAEATENGTAQPVQAEGPSETSDLGTGETEEVDEETEAAIDS